MNCDDVKLRLIESLYGELSPEDEARFREHLAGCDACRHEMAGLEQSRRQLERVEEPDVRVDLGRLYRTAADRGQRNRRRWRRVAMAASAAAVLMAALVGARLRFERRPGRLIVSWGARPTATQAVQPAPSDALPPLPGQYEERLAALEEVARLLSVELSRNDARHAAAMAELRGRLARSERGVEELTRRSHLRWRVAEENIRDLYLAQLSPDSSVKGAVP
jgi:hypothetical protein